MSHLDDASCFQWLLDYLVNVGIQPKGDGVVRAAGAPLPFRDAASWATTGTLRSWIQRNGLSCECLGLRKWQRPTGSTQHHSPQCHSLLPPAGFCRTRNGPIRTKRRDQAGPLG